MKPSAIFSKKTLLFALIVIPVAVIATRAGLKDSLPYKVLTPNTCSCYADSTSYITPVTFFNTVPGDLVSFINQSQVDCFAWQEFIALNWPTKPSAGFGDPNDLSFVQWETYMPREVLFPDDGSKPPAWGTLVSDEYSRLFKSQKLLMNKTQTKLLTFTSKIDEDDDAQVNFTPNQAAPQDKPSWLGAQNKTNVWYEIMLNKDYYDYIVQTGFYNAATQHDSIKAGNSINFPSGEYNGAVGAIELKAAWMEVDNPQSAKWARYKQSQATVMDPVTKKLRNTRVALVGLHILHKTENQSTWVWATFEQVDNVPVDANPNAQPQPPYGYNFYSPQCQNQTVTLVNGSQVTVGCNANVPPPYYLYQGGPVPTQTTRINPIDPLDAAPINAVMQKNIKKFYPNSVWQYYELVDVIWSQGPQPNPPSPVYAPRNLNVSSMASGTTVVANSTMETYIQSSAGNTTCFSCHMYSTVAAYPPDSVNNNVFGDFSFAISFAKYNTSAAKQKKLKKSSKKAN